MNFIPQFVSKVVDFLQASGGIVSKTVLVESEESYIFRLAHEWKPRYTNLRYVGTRCT
jgi:hypothetical protein